ncbi:MAG TPA: HAD family hydrolase [Anaerolineales bacterium]
MPIRALLFDFDGLILDTETPEVQVWKAIYAEHGHEYTAEHWSQIIGGWGMSTFDPAEELGKLSAGSLDVDALRSRHRQESNGLIDSSPVMEGVREQLSAARRLGLRCAIASSSERAWVEPHLKRLGLIEYFETITTGDDVAKGRTKPHPDIYLKALQSLQLGASEALVLEDSPNGVAAAHAAGLRVIGVPNPVTAGLKLEAEMVLGSLGDLPLEEILKRIEGSPRTPPAPRALPSTAS